MSSIIEINAVESAGLLYSPHFPMKVTIVGSFMSIHSDLISMHMLTKGISLHLIFCNLLFLHNIYLKPFHATIVYIPNHLSFYKWILHSLTVSVSLVLFFFCDYKPGIVSVLATLCIWRGPWVVSDSFLLLACYASASVHAWARFRGTEFSK